MRAYEITPDFHATFQKTWYYPTEIYTPDIRWLASKERYCLDICRVGI